METASQDITRRYWWSGWWGTQEGPGLCTAYAWLHWLTSAPKPLRGPLPQPERIHAEAQQFEAQEVRTGLSVEAAALYLQGQGLVGTCYLVEDLETAVDSILHVGPLVAGSRWPRGMGKTNAEGFVNTRGNERSAGHAYLLNGVDTERAIFRLKNSRGRAWGKDGHAYIGFEEYEALSSRGSEIFLPLPPR